MDHGNIEKSEVVIATILRLLIERGIKGGELDFASLHLGDEYIPFFATCFTWLVDEGLIRAAKVTVVPGDGEDAADDLYVYNPTLTSQGFALLGQRVKIGETTTTIGEAVESRSDGKPRGWQMGDFLGGILGGFTKSVGS